MHTAILTKTATRRNEDGKSLERGPAHGFLFGGVPGYITQRSATKNEKALRQADPEAMKGINQMTRAQIKKERGSSDSLDQAATRFFTATPYMSEDSLKGQIGGLLAGGAAGALGGLAMGGRKAALPVAATTGFLGSALGGVAGTVSGARKGWDAARKNELVEEALARPKGGE